ncbi:MAG: VanW family protein [Cellulomonas sp.]|nr:VanW family protein [Cellulomonas sp.]
MAGAVVLLVGVYVAACFALSDRVPRGTTVAGVSIGGKSSADARKALDSGLADVGTTPVAVVADGQESTFVPAEAGLAFDAQATVKSVTGPRLTEPGHLWRHIVGGGATTPVTTTDGDKLEETVAVLDTPVRVDPVDATVVFGDGAAQVTPAADGQGLDTAAAARTIAAQWLTADEPLRLKIVTIAPQITDDAARRAVTEQAEPLMAGPITVVVEDSEAKLTVAQLTEGASFVPKDGGLALTLNGPGLVRHLAEQLPDLLDDAADAHFDFDASGSPVIVDGVPGSSVAPDTLAAALVEASTTVDRTATVPLVASDPEHSREDLEGLGIKEVVGEYKTPLNSEPRRTQNITNGASLVSGTLVRPGETFSLGKTISPIDGSNGFVKAGVINQGMHVDGMGGGLSQLSTTTFNAAFESGMALPGVASQVEGGITNKPHSEYISRYPEGRESTLSYPGVDMQWTNNTPYGALLKAWVGPCSLNSAGCVYVQVWSTKYWTVESETFPRSGHTAPTTKHKSGANCSPSSAGVSGFVSTGVRRVYLDGELKDEWRWSWRYEPAHAIVCDG